MPFGFINALGTFPPAMDPLLMRVKWQFALVYVDEIAIFLRTPDENTKLVLQTLTLLDEAGVTHNLKKLDFITN